MDEYSLYMMGYLYLQGKEAYQRHLDRREENGDEVYPLYQLTAMASTGPMKEGFVTKLVRQARLLLCSYILGLEEPAKSFKDLSEYDLYVLYGLFRSEDYEAEYTADLAEVYKTLCQMQNKLEPKPVRHYVSQEDGVNVVKTVTD